MRTATSILALAALLIGASPRPALAQTAAPKGYVTVSGGAQSAAGSLSDTFTFERYAENGTVDVDYPGKAATLFDIGAGLRIRGPLGLGVAFSRGTVSGSADVSASVPHPLFDNRHRQVDGEASAITRNESGVHVSLDYHVRTTGKLAARLFAGPSFFNVEQEIVTGVEVDETYPYDTATFARATSMRAKGSAVGFNAGADVSWLFTRSFGLGAIARFTRGTADLDADGRTVSSDAGGFQVGGGVRFFF